MSTDNPPNVVVVGSANMDVVVPVKHHPRPGETVLGGALTRVAGGKGANQAVACARLGATTSFVGSVGQDDAADVLLEALRRDNVNVDDVVRRDRASGHALIAVNESGENTIVVSAGANAALVAEDLPAELVASAHALLLQLEIPIEAVMAAAAQTSGLVVLNPAPAADLPSELLAATDVLVPNLSELAHLTGQREDPQTVAEIAELARTIAGPTAVVVTVGVEGAVVVQHKDVVHVPALPVHAVDTTAAGDTFCAALTVTLAKVSRQADTHRASWQFADLVAAVEYAVQAASITVSHHGAQPSIPTAVKVAAAVNSAAQRG